MLHSGFEDNVVVLVPWSCRVGLEFILLLEPIHE